MEPVGHAAEVPLGITTVTSLVQGTAQIILHDFGASTPLADLKGGNFQCIFPTGPGNDVVLFFTNEDPSTLTFANIKNGTKAGLPIYLLRGPTSNVDIPASIKVSQFMNDTQRASFRYLTFVVDVGNTGQYKFIARLDRDSPGLNTFEAVELV